MICSSDLLIASYLIRSGVVTSTLVTMFQYTVTSYVTLYVMITCLRYSCKFGADCLLHIDFIVKY